MSPPSSCTVGRMRESNNSLIIMTVSSSSSLICVSAFGFVSVTSGSPLAKKSMIVAKISGFRTPHSASSCFDTVMKSPPKNTARTPSMRKRILAMEKQKNKKQQQNYHDRIVKSKFDSIGLFEIVTQWAAVRWNVIGEIFGIARA